MIFSRVHPSYFFTKHFTFLDGVIFAEFFFYSQSITSSPINLTTPFLPHSLLPQLRLSSRWHSLEFPSVPLFKFISFQTIQPFMNDLYTSFSGHTTINIEQTSWYIVWIPQMFVLMLYLTRCHPIFPSPTSH